MGVGVGEKEKEEGQPFVSSLKKLTGRPLRLACRPLAQLSFFRWGIEDLDRKVCEESFMVREEVGRAIQSESSDTGKEEKKREITIPRDGANIKG